MIERLPITHLHEAFSILVQCKKALEQQGIFQWTDHYPTAQTVALDIAEGTLFGLKQEGICTGIITLNTEQEEAYKTIDWQDKGENILVIHRLAVRPDYQQQGIATRLMDFAEEYAQQQGCTSIRLDSYSGNTNSIAFYHKRGYADRGRVNFPGRELPFVCFEKVL